MKRRTLGSHTFAPSHPYPWWAAIMMAVVTACTQPDPDEDWWRVSTTGLDRSERSKVATGMDASWCIHAQQLQARLAGSSISLADIGNTFHASEQRFTQSRVIIDADANPRLQLQSYAHPFAARLPQGTAPLSDHVDCKVRSLDRIAITLKEDLHGTQGTCQEVNQTAWDWARDQLSEHERSRYDQTGKKLVMGEDLPCAGGSAWLETDPWFEPLSNGSYVYHSPALFTPAWPGVGGISEKDWVGVYYCKLLSPAYALLWMTSLAFTVDPPNP